MPQFQPGDVLSRERTFTADDVRVFTEVSHDRGAHHVTPDEKGRLMLHGLLTACLGTEIGGSINFIASEMLFRFVRPVWAGDTVRCDVKVEKVRNEPDRQLLELTFVMKNQHGKDVLTGEIRGMVRQ